MSDELSQQQINAHYERITPVADALARVGENLAVGLNDYYGWYVKRDHDNMDALEDGYEREGRCATLAKDYDTVKARIDRSLYAMSSYDDPAAHAEWGPCTITDGETEWQDAAPTSGYADLRGVMVWGDIDLAGGLKEQRGDLSDETRQAVEKTLSAYIDEYARLYGGRDAVYALDSVGGAYIMGAPAATLPIADLFEDDADALARVMEAFVDRSNDWLADAQRRVEMRVDGAADVIDPDWVNNNNRQYKAPMSLHAKHDAVVTPMDTDDVSYTLTRFSDVTDALVEETAEWAASLTSTDYTDRVDTLVEHLWPDEHGEHGDWQAALKAWVEAERKLEEQQERARKRARERRRERKEQIGGGVEGAPVTPFIEDVYDALDDIPVRDVIKKHACDGWDTGRDSNDKIEFDPSWRTSDSGSSCFVDTDSNTFGDSGMAAGGHAAEAMALGDPSINYTDPNDDLTGDKWRRAADSLRDAGYDVPVYTPDARSVKNDGEEYDKMPLWSVRKAAVALGVLPEDAFITRHRESGGFQDFPGAETYNHALAAIEDAGLEHGREYRTDSGTRPADTGTDAVDGTTGDTEDESDDGGADGDAETPPDTDGVVSEDAEDGNNIASFSSLDQHRGAYGTWETDREGKTYFDKVAGFTLDVDSFLFKDDERIINMTVVPASGEQSYDLTVSADVFNDARRFRDNVVTGLTTTFEGGAAELNQLRKLVGGQDAPVRTGTHHMGLHTDTGEFVTPNGVLTAEGWESDPETAYIEREIGAERAFGLDPDEHDGYDPKEVTEILELLPKSRFSERFLPALGWLYSAPLRPYIQQWEGQFNTLHVTGETGAGKSSTLSVLWQLLGMDGEPMACDDTKFALLTAMASTNSIPMWFDEYKPGDMKDWEVDRFQNLMRSTTRGGVATRGNADKSTEEYQLQAPLMISGEQSIQGPAEQRRSIQTRFRDGVKESGSETKAAFAKLTGMSYTKDGETVDPDGYDLSQHALAYYQFVLRQPPKMLKEQWTKSRDHVRELLAARGITGVDDLPRQGVQTIHFGMTLYRAFAEEMCGELGVERETLDLPGGDEVNDAMLYIARQFGDEGSRKSHMDRFVELTARAATEEYLEREKHYKFVKEGSEDEQLALKLSSVHDRVSKYVRDHGLDSEDLLNNASDYRDRMSEAADDTDSYVVTHSQKTPPLARCARIDTGMAESQLEFSRLAFGADPPDDGEDGEESTSDDDGDGPGGDGMTIPDAPAPVGIVDIDPAQQDVATTTGAVEFREFDGRDTSEGTPAWTATLFDGDAEAKLVVWDEDDIPALYDETGVFTADALRVTGASVSKYDDTAQLVVTDSTQVYEAPDDDQYQLDEQDAPETTDDTEAVADGGTENDTPDGTGGESDAEPVPEVGCIDVPTDATGPAADAKRIADWVEEKGPKPETALMNTMTLTLELMDPSAFKTAIETGTEKGILIADGEIRSAR